MSSQYVIFRNDLLLQVLDDAGHLQVENDFKKTAGKSFVPCR